MKNEWRNWNLSLSLSASSSSCGNSISPPHLLFAALPLHTHSPERMCGSTKGFEMSAFICARAASVTASQKQLSTLKEKTCNLTSFCLFSPIPSFQLPVRITRHSLCTSRYSSLPLPACLSASFLSVLSSPHNIASHACTRTPESTNYVSQWRSV